MPNISENILMATRVLQMSGIVDPRREASSLLAFTLGSDKTFLVAYPEYALTSDEENRFREFLRRRASREPFQHITGKQEFYGLDFEVTADVLIPRPETELIVENAVEILRAKQHSHFCEVGVGSGCISVSILHEVKTATAIGLDVSQKALEIAGRNAARHQVSGRIELKISDVLERLDDEKFDLIVSNPPYIPQADIESLQAEVRDFEPLTALTDHFDGLSIIEKIISESPSFLKPGGFLLIEIGYNQSEKVRAMFSPGSVWLAVEILDDLQGIPRMVKAKIGN